MTRRQLAPPTSQTPGHHFPSVSKMVRASQPSPSQHTTECRHVWETWPDGQVRCFECDARRGG